MFEIISAFIGIFLLGWFVVWAFSVHWFFGLLVLIIILNLKD